MLLVRHVFPEFAGELHHLVLWSDRPDLAAQVLDLAVVDRCRCSQENCAQFYTAPRPAGAYGPGHSNVALGGPGTTVLDVVADRIVAVEVLDRSDVKQRLDAVWPLVFAQASWSEIDTAMRAFLADQAGGHALEPILRFLLAEMGRHDADWSTETLEAAVEKARTQLLARRPELSKATVDAMVSHYGYTSK